MEQVSGSGARHSSRPIGGPSPDPGPPKVLKVTTVIKDGDQYTGAATFEAPRPADTADAYDRHAPYQPRERTGFTASAPPTPHQKPALDASGHAESRGEPSGAARRLKVLAAAEARTAAAAAAAAPPPRALSEDDEEEDVEEQLAAAVQAAVTQHAGLDPRAELAGMLLASNQRPVSGAARARQEIFLRRAKLAAEMQRMGLPPLIDYGGAGGYVYGKPVQLPPPATAATAGAGVTAAAGAGVRGGTLKSASKNPIHAQDAAAKRRLSRKSAASGGSAASAAAPLVAATSAASAAAAEASGSGAPLPPPQYLQAALPSLSSTSAAATAVRGPLVVTTGQGHLLMAATNVTRPHTRRKDRQPTNEIIGGNMDGQRIKAYLETIKTVGKPSAASSKPRPRSLSPGAAEAADQVLLSSVDHAHQERLVKLARAMVRAHALGIEEYGVAVPQAEANPAAAAAASSSSSSHERRRAAGRGGAQPVVQVRNPWAASVRPLPAAAGGLGGGGGGHNTRQAGAGASLLDGGEEEKEEEQEEEEVDEDVVELARARAVEAEVARASEPTFRVLQHLATAQPYRVNYANPYLDPEYGWKHQKEQARAAGGGSSSAAARPHAAPRAAPGSDRSGSLTPEPAASSSPAQVALLSAAASTPALAADGGSHSPVRVSIESAVAAAPQVGATPPSVQQPQQQLAAAPLQQAAAVAIPLPAGVDEAPQPRPQFRSSLFQSAAAQHAAASQPTAAADAPVLAVPSPPAASNVPVSYAAPPAAYTSLTTPAVPLLPAGATQSPSAAASDFAFSFQTALATTAPASPRPPPASPAPAAAVRSSSVSSSPHDRGVTSAAGTLASADLSEGAAPRRRAGTTAAPGRSGPTGYSPQEDLDRFRDLSDGEEDDSGGGGGGGESDGGESASSWGITDADPLGFPLSFGVAAHAVEAAQQLAAARAKQALLAPSDSEEEEEDEDDDDDKAQGGAATGAGVLSSPATVAVVQEGALSIATVLGRSGPTAASAPLAGPGGAPSGGQNDSQQGQTEDDDDLSTRDDGDGKPSGKVAAALANARRHRRKVEAEAAAAASRRAAQAQQQIETNELFVDWGPGVRPSDVPDVAFSTVPRWMVAPMPWWGQSSKTSSDAGDLSGMQRTDAPRRQPMANMIRGAKQSQPQHGKRGSRATSDAGGSDGASDSSVVLPVEAALRQAERRRAVGKSALAYNATDFFFTAPPRDT